MVKEGCVMSKVQELIDPVSHCWDISGLREALGPGSTIEALKTLLVGP